MPTFLHFCDDPTIAIFMRHLVRDLTQDVYRFETINTAHPETAIAAYTSTEAIGIVVVESPRDIAAVIQQLRAHPQLNDANVMIITGRPQLYQSLASAKVAIGDKLDRIPMLRTLLSERAAI